MARIKYKVMHGIFQQDINNFAIFEQSREMYDLNKIEMIYKGLYLKNKDTFKPNEYVVLAECEEGKNNWTITKSIGANKSSMIDNKK